MTVHVMERDDACLSNGCIELDGSYLTERWHGIEFRYSCWDADIFTCEVNDGHGWIEHLPSWRLIDQDGDLNNVAFQSDPKTQRHRLDAECERLWPFREAPNQIVPQWNDSEPAHDVFQAFIDLIPNELAHAIGALEQYQWVALEAAWHHPPFAAFLVKTIERYGPRFILMAYHLAKPLKRSRSWRLLVAEQIAIRRANDFLSWLCGRPLALGAIRVIGHLSAQNLTPDQTASLTKLLFQQEYVDTLLTLGRVNISAIEVFEMWPAWLWTPKLIRLINRYEAGADLIYDWTGEFTQVKDQHRSKLRAYLETSCDYRQLFRRVGHELTEVEWNKVTEYLTPSERLYVPFPGPPIESDLLLPIRNASELQEEAFEGGNCLMMYEDVMRAGRAYAFKWTKGKRLVVLLTREEGEEWRLDAIRDMKDEEPSRKWTQRVEREFNRLTVQFETRKSAGGRGVACI